MVPVSPETLAEDTDLLSRRYLTPLSSDPTIEIQPSLPPRSRSIACLETKVPPPLRFTVDGSGVGELRVIRVNKCPHGDRIRLHRVTDPCIDEVAIVPGESDVIICGSLDIRIAHIVVVSILPGLSRIDHTVIKGVDPMGIAECQTALPLGTEVIGAADIHLRSLSIVVADDLALPILIGHKRALVRESSGE